MKKTYQKPEIMFEDFSLSTSIALGCEHRAKHAMFDCAYEDEKLGVSVFVAGVEPCVFIPPTEDDHNGICYHVPVETSNIFAS